MHSDALMACAQNRMNAIESVDCAAATIGALTPMALGVTGGGGFISQPLAIVVIGGLISSTLLTLLLVPTLYTMVESTQEKFRQRHSPQPSAETRTLVPTAD